MGTWSHYGGSYRCEHCPLRGTNDGGIAVAVEEHLKEQIGQLVYFVEFGESWGGLR